MSSIKRHGDDVEARGFGEVDELAVCLDCVHDAVLREELRPDLGEHRFSPPLNQGKWERPNASRTNRRDIIMPNYSTDGFWYHLRQAYQADHILSEIRTPSSCSESWNSSSRSRDTPRASRAILPKIR